MRKMQKFVICLLMILPFSATSYAVGGDNPFTVEQLSIPGIVDVESTSGEIGSSNASAQAAEPVTNKEQKEQVGYVNVNTRLNVRTGPWGKIIGKLYDGEKLKIIGREGDWLKIRYNGGVAYVHSHYVEMGEERVARPDPEEGGSNPGSGPVGNVPDGSLDPARYGYSSRFKSVFDVVEKFCSSNKAYVFGAGHTKKSGYTDKTDCSGFVGQFIQKMAELSGVPPVFPKNSWYPSSQIYKTQHTKKITSSFPPPNPRDSIKPGDVFVMNPGSSGIGHVGLFMGYTPSGQPIIAHSTPTRVNSSTKIAGKTGYSGVRIEVLPSRYRSRWAGVYRIKNMEQTLNRLSS
ncbi:MAG: SH3 domain-containing protein [Candidatus Rifleibacteriota bacterium]